VILYKYFKYEDGLAAFDSRKCVFTKPAHFNDPFELNYLKKTLSSFDSHHYYSSKWLDSIINNSAITCFTKQPLNPLMWSHYADSHSGLVIGYEVDIPFFTSSEHNIVTIHDGDVVYSTSQPEFNLSKDDVMIMERLFFATTGDMELYRIYSDALRIARRLFLTKSSCWSYEEEVRVVKGVNRNLREEADFPDADRLRLCKPFDSKIYSNSTKSIIFEHEMQIAEVYLGCKADDLPKECHLINQNCKFFRVAISDHGWNLCLSPL